MPIDVFISYAHKDKKMRDELITHLAVLRLQGLIQHWYDGDIVPGTEWEPQIMEHLNNAHMILLLISARFIASEFCYGIELQTAMARHDEGKARVIPILLYPCVWNNTPFAKLQALPTGVKPVAQWPSRDEALTDVVKGIKRVIQDLSAGAKGHS
jgi:hypothetical protein